jgi:hypothetical protein
MLKTELVNNNTIFKEDTIFKGLNLYHIIFGNQKWIASRASVCVV